MCVLDGNLFDQRRAEASHSAAAERAEDLEAWARLMHNKSQALLAAGPGAGQLALWRCRGVLGRVWCMARCLPLLHLPRRPMRWA